MKKVLDSRRNLTKFLVLLFILNLMDMVLTVWQMNLFGLDIEKNPFIKMLVEEFGYGLTIGFKAVVGFILCFYIYYRYDGDLYVKKPAVKKRVKIVLWIIIVAYGLINLLHIFNLSLYAFFRYFY